MIERQSAKVAKLQMGLSGLTELKPTSRLERPISLEQMATLGDGFYGIIFYWSLFPPQIPKSCPLQALNPELVILGSSVCQKSVYN